MSDEIKPQVDGERPPLTGRTKSAREALEKLKVLAVGGDNGVPADTTSRLELIQELLSQIGPDVNTAIPGHEEGAVSDQVVYFDVSDLLGYFPDNRLPTGIQRVQISTILALLDRPGGWSIRICRFLEQRDEWRTVPTQTFRVVCELSMGGGDSSDIHWRAAVAQLDSAVQEGPELSFEQGAWLVNLGTSWWLPNYFAYIRKAKLESGIRYVPLVHDLIPAITPQYCNHELVHEFIDWLMGVLQHADCYLTVSDSTREDLLKLAGDLGLPLQPELVKVVPLASEVNALTPSEGAAAQNVASLGLKDAGYVLFVSTIEARKNQLGALEAWHQLINVHGIDAVPTLVLVGKRGFEHDRVYNRLHGNQDLESRVKILDGVNDADLELLYRRCLFTIYPSYYEGWGLPVTESLQYGKVPVIADNSSLPQAGYGLAVAYETGSTKAFVASLEKMIFDNSYRSAAEQKVRQGFHLRRWSHVAEDLVKHLDLFAAWSKTHTLPSWQPPHAESGYYPLTRNRQLKVVEGLTSSEIFRSGAGWWRMEDFGCWTKRGGAKLEFQLPKGAAGLALKLVGLSEVDSNYRVMLDATGQVLEQGRMSAGTETWRIIEIPPESLDGVITLTILGESGQVVIDPVTRRSRTIYLGVAAFFVADPASRYWRSDFVEALALGALDNYRLERLPLAEPAT